MAADFQLIEISFGPIDFTPTLEDEFTMTAVSKEIENAEDIEHLRHASMNLLKVAMHRQAVIRGLCKRLAKIETYGVTKKMQKG